MTYIAIRDDSRSLSSNERAFVRENAFSSRRVDGRGPNDLRKIKLHLSRRDNEAECTVQWGETRVSAALTAILQPPQSEDRPSEGILSISVDISPMASTAFGMALPLSTTPGDNNNNNNNSSKGNRSNFTPTADDSQKLLGNRILRSLERTILLGGALDTEALCVQSAAWVWKLSLSVKIFDHGGNLLDAAVLAAMASLRHYRKPQVDLVEGGIPILLSSDTREPTPLPLHHTPLSISFALIHADDVALLSTLSTLTVAALVDPTDREELVQTGSITIAMNIHGEVCLLDFGGGCELQHGQLKDCWKLAERCVKQLCDMLETFLKEADEKAQEERLHRLQREHKLRGNDATLSNTNYYQHHDPIQVPFWSEEENVKVDTTSPLADTGQEIVTAEQTIKDMEQESYRLQALEYNQGHVAAKVKENVNTQTSRKEKSLHGNSSVLLSAMLQSVSKTTTEDFLLDRSKKGPDQSKDLDHDDVRKSDTADKSIVGIASNLQKNAFQEFVTAQKEMKDAMQVEKDVDDEEEEEEEEAPIMLKTEFDFDKVPPKSTVANPMVDRDDNIDDLALAIKSKSKKKKKK